MNFVDKFLRMLKRGISKWIKMPKKKKLLEEDKKVLSKLLEEYTLDAILEHFGLMSKSAIVSSKLLEELRQLRKECRDRKKSARLAKKYPYKRDYEPDENCLLCNADLESKIECDLKNQMLEVKKELDRVLPKTEIIQSKLMDEIREIHRICRERYNSARIRKEHPIDHRHEKNEECLICKGNIDNSEVECIIKYQFREVQKMLDRD